MKRFVTTLFALFLVIAAFADIDWKTQPLRITAREDSTTMYIICHIDLDKHIAVNYDIYTADGRFRSRYEFRTKGEMRYEGDNMEKRGYLFSLDSAECNEWANLTRGDTVPYLNKGDYVIVYGSNSHGIGSGTFTKERHLTMSFPHGTVDISGNVMSLIVGKEDDRLDTAQYIPSDVCFARLFNHCPDARDAICTDIMTGPVDASNMILPATQLRHACYDRMFNSCNLLEKMPNLPATDMAEFCYLQTFGGCISLEEPAEMNAVNLYSNCCRHMFQSCTALKSTPLLPAEELVGSAYYGMFDGCGALSEVKVKFTDWIEGSGTPDWLLNVAETGVFYCREALPLEYGVSFIPEGWTTEILEEPITPDPSAIDNIVDNNNSARKVMLNGQIYIVRDGQLYDLTGRMVTAE